MKPTKRYADEFAQPTPCEGCGHECMEFPCPWCGGDIMEPGDKLCVVCDAKLCTDDDAKLIDELEGS